MALPMLIISAILAPTFIVLLMRLCQVGRRPNDLPPGPPTIPILGNLHLMPKGNVHLQFQQWAHKYGSIYSVILGTKTMIVLNSAKAVKDLLDRRSAIYSSRTDNYVSQDLTSGGMRILLLVCYPNPLQYSLLTTFVEI